MTFIKIYVALICALLLASCVTLPDQNHPNEAAWKIIETEGSPTARHEASLVAYKDKLYLIGGRRMNPVDVYDPATNRWEERSTPPIELHHFQAVVHGDAIYILGAMTGGWPNETPVDRVIAYYPERDVFEFLHEIPKARQRGGAGAVVYDDKIYLVGGITNGHMDGYVAWTDTYDPATGDWQVLEDAPHARDHFQAVIADDKLYAMAGRKTRHRTGEGFDLTNTYGDVFDLSTHTWHPVTENMAIPTKRAGNMAIAWNGQVWVGGGESGTQVVAHNEVDIYDPAMGQWYEGPALARGRHGSGFAILGGYLYTASGTGNRGGEPELETLERLKLPEPKPVAQNNPGPGKPRHVHQQWHTITLPFEGPQTSELDAKNPFTDYRLDVDFIHAETTYTIRGFYAADGNAAQTGADRGRIWQVRFTPDKPGTWTYNARLSTGPMIALHDTPDAGDDIELENAAGAFFVAPSGKDGRDFRAKGRLVANGSYFRFSPSGEPWLKGGANSPENLLGYTDFDGAYRIATQAREGEAATSASLHSFSPHEGDWKLGDPSWRDGKGKGLVGAINYLASEGMNSVYFLTMNIGGDGKDVWPFNSPQDFTRFDVSKLEQWEIVFSHMQEQGILLHMVLQETENELLFDEGDTGPERQLYLNELIARFGHHSALVWNLGEENGPVSWLPEGQSDAQRRHMANYIQQQDPYGHPVLLHTHAEPHDKDTIVSPLLGFEALDGLSFQVAERTKVNSEIRKWHSLAREAGRPWLITMDEIGMWPVGARHDLDDPTHDSLRRHVLWGTLLGGGAGVEWYFGAHQKGNDLTTEDWRSRANLWSQTRHALTFFSEYLPYWTMTPCPADPAYGYCMTATESLYVYYLIEDTPLDLSALPVGTSWQADWYDPMQGGELIPATPVTAGAGDTTPARPQAGQDWVLLLRAME